jgi:hypothetical protein
MRLEELLVRSARWTPAEEIAIGPIVQFAIGDQPSEPLISEHCDVALEVFQLVQELVAFSRRGAVVPAENPGRKFVQRVFEAPGDAVNETFASDTVSRVTT